MIKRICVYCASSSKSDKIYLEAAYKLGKICAQKNVTIVYGGGAVGLMGSLAQGILDYNGTIVGVIPQFMVDMEWAHRGVREMHIVQTMHQRKRMMMEHVDAAVALPGGSGTLEELVETISLKRLGIFLKPVIILNTNNFYDPLLKFFNHCIDHKFMDKRHRAIWCVVNKSDDVLTEAASAPAWPGDARRFAVV